MFQKPAGRTSIGKGKSGTRSLADGSENDDPGRPLGRS